MLLGVFFGLFSAKAQDAISTKAFFEIDKAKREIAGVSVVAPYRKFDVNDYNSSQFSLYSKICGLKRDGLTSIHAGVVKASYGGEEIYVYFNQFNSKAQAQDAYEELSKKLDCLKRPFCPCGEQVECKKCLSVYEPVLYKNFIIDFNFRKILLKKNNNFKSYLQSFKNPE